MKLCVDCKWYSAQGSIRCIHPMLVDIVTGKLVGMDPWQARDARYCFRDFWCGPEAHSFEPK